MSVIGGKADVARASRR